MSSHTIQQILHQHRNDVVQQLRLPVTYLKALDKLAVCRTAALGGHAQYCENRHLNGIWYNSCKHRGCPQCRSMATEEWLLNTKNILLDCPHHHVIFTIPSELHDLWRYNQSVMTDILFKAVQDTLKTFAKDRKYLGASPGMLCALHTWGRSLSLHPHIHALVSHGGVNSLGDWVEPRKKSLFPQKPVMMVYRGKLLSRLKAALSDDRWKIPRGESETTIRNLINKLGRQDWVVHFCKRYNHAQGVATYLSRYVKSGPLRNQQIKVVTDSEVTYEYKSHQTKSTEMLTMSIEQFIRRVVQHMPLPGKPTVRYSGIYQGAARKKLNKGRESLGQLAVSERQVLDWQQFMQSKGILAVCTECGQALTIKVSVLAHRKKR